MGLDTTLRQGPQTLQGSPSDVSVLRFEEVMLDRIIHDGRVLKCGPRRHEVDIHLGGLVS